MDKIEAMGAAIHQQHMADERKAMTDTQPVVTQADIAAAEKQAKKSYRTLYDYEMDLRKSFAAHRNRATAALQAQLDMAVEALKWYQEQSRLCRLIHSEGDIGRNALAADGGRRADRAAVIRECAAAAGRKKGIYLSAADEIEQAILALIDEGTGDGNASQ